MHLLRDLTIWTLGAILVLGLALGAMAQISGNLSNADNIGGSIGRVAGAGIFGGIFGDNGMVSEAFEQRDRFNPPAKKND